MPNKIAETDPPVIPPIYVPRRSPIAGTGSMLKVIGRASAKATVKVSPGIEPKTSPTKAPKPIENMAKGVKARAKA